MRGYVTNIENDTLENQDFRRVLYTAKNTQLVLMSLRANEEIGEEIHDLDQFIRVEAGQGLALSPSIATAQFTRPRAMPSSTRNISTAKQPNRRRDESTLVNRR